MGNDDDNIISGEHAFNELCKSMKEKLDYAEKFITITEHYKVALEVCEAGKRMIKRKKKNKK